MVAYRQKPLKKDGLVFSFFLFFFLLNVHAIFFFIDLIHSMDTAIHIGDKQNIGTRLIKYDLTFVCFRLIGITRNHKKSLYATKTLLICNHLQM